MDFAEVLEKVLELLQRQGRVSYRALKLRFQLDDEFLEGIKDELIDAQRVARDEEGKVLVWVDGTAEEEPENRRTGESEKKQTPPSDSRLSTLDAKGVSTLVPVYRVLRESEAQSRFEVALRTGLTPLIGREHEVGKNVF
jgi:hypothetical protein